MMNIQQNQAIWERQTGESDKAYAAFSTYRNLGVSRSIDVAYAHLKGTKGGQKGDKRAPTFFAQWSSDNDWKTRAEAWDSEQDRKRREQVEATQREELESFRLQLRKDNEQFARAARVSMQKALDSLDRLTDEDLSVRDAARLLTAATVAIKTANEIQAQALGLDELVGMLNDDANRDDERAGGARETATA